MKQVKNIETRVDEALDSLDGIHRATPQPYFYTRLRARMNRESHGWAGVASLLGRPAFALAMICVVLFVNSWIVFRADKESVSGNNMPAISDEFPAEYDLTVTTLYNYETP